MNTLWKLWASLLAFLTLGVDDETTDDDPPGDDTTVDAEDEPTVEAEGLTFDEVLEAAEDALPRAKPGPKPARNLEVELAEERGRRMALESRPAPAPVPFQPQTRDPEAEREDAEYRAAVAAGEDADRLAMREWQIKSNRAIRNAARTSSQAELNARDFADRAEFGRLEITNPKAFKRYSAEVENMVANARAQGQAVPRKMVMQTLIGRDFLDGKIKPKSRAARTEGKETTQVDRGRMPGTRSDVGRRSTGKLSAGQEAAKRLEGKLI